MKYGNPKRGGVCHLCGIAPVSDVWIGPGITLGSIRFHVSLQGCVCPLCLCNFPDILASIYIQDVVSWGGPARGRRNPCFFAGQAHIAAFPRYFESWAQEASNILSRRRRAVCTCRHARWARPAPTKARWSLVNPSFLSAFAKDVFPALLRYGYDYGKGCILSSFFSFILTSNKISLAKWSKEDVFLLDQ